MSGNHNQSLERALAIVDAAADAGAHAIKLQTYTADTMTLNLDHGEFHIEHPLWGGQSLYALYQQAYTPWEWHEPIFKRAYDRGMFAFSTPFDKSAVDFLESLQVPAYKIASFENTDLPLLRKVAATGKPLLISTGMATLAELDESVRAVRQAGCKELVLLKCTSAYPANQRDSHIRTIPHMRELFSCEVGLSDHTLGIGAAVAAVALGATVIEKHFTLSRADGGVDAAFSLEPTEFAQLCKEVKNAWEALGEINYGVMDTELNSHMFRRSLYVVQDMEKGEQFTEGNVRAIRPGKGLAPKYLDIVYGKTARQFISKGTPLSWDLLW
ncbi:pseudaminic acid synthase [Rhodoferax sp. 4810]|uniref:Pseudaminic acid synthase n=2 Tax=Thiospirillum jenense TaxID=1653858 RepID=A0A839HBQ7_9GAMM|nr:pseudaminic acid synthase [Rhodoferax jenense]MBB1125994.1 pseudaminic acid synthase [Thiospirillum jenense]